MKNGWSSFVFILFLTGLYFLLLTFLTLFQRRHHHLTNYTRRLAHVITGLYGIAFAWQTNCYCYAAFCFAFWLATMWSRRVQLVTCIHAVKRETYGELLMCWSFALMAIMADNRWQVFLTSGLILTLADPLGGLVGDIRKKETKTIFGSVVFWMLTTAICVWVDQLTLASATTIGFILAIMERTSPYGSDNLTVPLLSTWLMLTF